MTIAPMFGALYLVYFQSANPWFASLIWPTVIVALALLVVFTPWGRGIVKISTKFGDLERRVADTVAKTAKQGQQLTSQQQQIDDQQRTLEKLVQDIARYSISDYIFYLLRDVDNAQRSHGEYLYRRDGTMWRNLRFLIDHGYIQEVYPEPEDRRNLPDIIGITPAGHALIALRARAGEASAAA